MRPALSSCVSTVPRDVSARPEISRNCGGMIHFATSTILSGLASAIAIRRTSPCLRVAAIFCSSAAFALGCPDTRPPTASHTQAIPGRPCRSCLHAIVLFLLFLPLFLFSIDLPARFEVGGGDDAIGVLMDRGQQYIPRDRLLQSGEVVDLGRLPRIGQELVEGPPLGHSRENLFNPPLRVRHVVRSEERRV